MKKRTKKLVAGLCVMAGIFIGGIITGNNMFKAAYWEEAAVINQWGWFGVFFGVFALCYFSFAVYMVFRAIYFYFRR